jgi:pyridoxal phosphate enzyme (YggS family)
MTFPELPGRLASVRERISAAQARAGHQHDVTIVAVTKTFGPEAVRAAVAAGLRDVGENRVQEALPKQDALTDLAVDWHLIGTLQQNKARRVVGRFALIHSVDRLGLAQEIDRRTAEGSRQPVLVQVNCSAEPQKGGVEPADLPALLDALRDCRRLEVRGLMTMAALTDDTGRQRAAFGLLRRLRDDAARAGHGLPVLSMGMSGDYETAVEEGATMVRLGTILFGGREA